MISASIPVSLEDSKFKLDDEEKSSAVVWDWNQHKLTKMAPELATGGVRCSSISKKFLLIMLALTILVIPIVAGWKFASKNKGHS